MRVHLLGVVSLNGGDAAILAGSIAAVRSRWPDAQISASDLDPVSAARYTADVDFYPYLLDVSRVDAEGRARGGRRGRARPALMTVAASLVGRGVKDPALALLAPHERRVLEAVAGADVVCWTGGTTLTENYDMTKKLFELEVARRLRRPMVFLQQSAGPFRELRNRIALGRIFRDADLLLLRDERSLGYVREVGAPSAVTRLLPDAAFALAPITLPGAPDHGGRPRVAVSLREWDKFDGMTAERGMDRYLTSVRAAVEQLVRDRGADVVFVSTCQGRPEYWTDDSAVALTAVAGLAPDVLEHVTVDREARTPQGLIDFLAGFDAMLSTRLHGAILAACAGLPTLAVAYEHKTHEVWGQLGLSDWVLDINDLVPDKIAARMVDLLDARAAVRDTLVRALPHQRAGALAAADLVADVLAGRPLSHVWTP